MRHYGPFRYQDRSICLSLSILGGMESTRVGEGTMGAGIDREDAQGVSSEGLQN